MLTMFSSICIIGLLANHPALLHNIANVNFELSRVRSLANMKVVGKHKSLWPFDCTPLLGTKLIR